MLAIINGGAGAGLAPVIHLPARPRVMRISGWIQLIMFTLHTGEAGDSSQSSCEATATVFRWLTSSTYNIVTSVTCTNTNQMEKYDLLIMSAQFSFLVTFGCESVFLANWPLTVLAEFYKELLVKWGNDYCPSYSRESVFVVCQSVRGFSCLSCGQLCGQFNACKTRNLQRGGECFQGPFQI